MATMPTVDYALVAVQNAAIALSLQGYKILPDDHTGESESVMGIRLSGDFNLTDLKKAALGEYSKLKMAKRTKQYQLDVEEASLEAFEGEKGLSVVLEIQEGSERASSFAKVVGSLKSEYQKAMAAAKKATSQAAVDKALA